MGISAGGTYILTGSFASSVNLDEDALVGDGSVDSEYVSGVTLS